jgi:hypothetical protein
MYKDTEDRVYITYGGRHFRDVDLDSGRAVRFDEHTLTLDTVWERKDKDGNNYLLYDSKVSVDYNGRHTCGVICIFVDGLIYCEKCEEVIDV